MSANPVPLPATTVSTIPGISPGYSDHRLSLGSFALEHGRVLRSASLACRIYGRDDIDKARGSGPVYVVLGGISANRHLCDDSAGQRGWWNGIVGPGKALDTRYCRVVTFDFLGSGDSTRPRTLTDWALTPADQARAFVLALQQLNIHQITGVIGASYGGMVALHWAQHYPTTLQRALVLCAAHRSSPTASAYRALQRQIVRFAAEHGSPGEGLRLARSLAMLGFRSRQELDQRFAGPGIIQAQQLFLPIENYLAARGSDYARTQHAASFHCLSQSCDLHRLNPGNISTELWLAGAGNDQVVPFDDLENLAARAPNVRYFQRIDSLYGHDCFLKEDAIIGGLVKTFTAGGAA